MNKKESWIWNACLYIIWCWYRCCWRNITF